jgi:hypothetical protein
MGKCFYNSDEGDGFEYLWDEACSKNIYKFLKIVVKRGLSNYSGDSVDLLGMVVRAVQIGYALVHSCAKKYGYKRVENKI